ncbi:MAG: chalcone isomerase family protein [Gammaproteobacteria bacterium]|nr:chalcone isomerase family protein [Gammaproteobacteria bacterium]
MVKTAIMCIFIVMPFSLQASVLGELKRVGQSSMNWAFFKLYDIELYSENGKFNNQQYPMALNIIYARNIEKNDLIDATIKEWEKQKIVWKQQWVEQLKIIWPSVKTQDQILLYADQQQHSHFYHNNALVGSIKSAEFTQMFLAIWLSPETSETELRHQLIGK